MVAKKIKDLLRSAVGSPKPTTENDVPPQQAIELSEKQIKQIERKLGYVFAEKGLLIQSLTHPSYLLHARNQLKNNQRLEFLGDSVIQLALTERLYLKYPKEREGKLTAIRSSYARGDFMASIARELKLNDYLILKQRDRNAGIADGDSALGDAFEAVIGAIYLDSNYEQTQKIIMRLYKDLNTPAEKEGIIANPKGKLQELVQPEHGNNAIRYETTNETGDPHNRVFEVTVFFKDSQLGTGTGKTKKDAAEKAALEAIEAWRKMK